MALTLSHTSYENSNIKKENNTLYKLDFKKIVYIHMSLLFFINIKLKFYYFW